MKYIIALAAVGSLIFGAYSAYLKYDGYGWFLFVSIILFLMAASLHKE